MQLVPGSRPERLARQSPRGRIREKGPPDAAAGWHESQARGGATRFPRAQDIVAHVGLPATRRPPRRALPVQRDSAHRHWADRRRDCHVRNLRSGSAGTSLMRRRSVGIGMAGPRPSGSIAVAILQAPACPRHQAGSRTRVPVHACRRDRHRDRLPAFRRPSHPATREPPDCGMSPITRVPPLLPDSIAVIGPRPDGPSADDGTKTTEHAARPPGCHGQRPAAATVTSAPP